MLDCKTTADIQCAKRGEEVLAYGVEITMESGAQRWMRGDDGLPWFGRRARRSSTRRRGTRRSDRD